MPDHVLLVNPRVIAVMEEFATESDMIRFPCSREHSGGNAEKDGLETPAFWTEGPVKRLLYVTLQGKR